MQRAKQAVADFVSHDGKHKTTVDESTAKAVTDEHIHPHQHENVTTAVDKDVHQDHHHTTVQPVTHKEILPELHTHHVMPVKEKEFHHGSERDTRSKLEHEAAKYKNTSKTHDTTHSVEMAPTVSGERVHHHVHEHVQPVIHKEVQAPSVVHTTVPIHEVHHNAAQHHGTSVLPTKTLDEFKRDGGVTEGRGSTKLGDHERCPKPYRKDMQTEHLDADKNMHMHTHGPHAGSHSLSSGSANAGVHDSNVANNLDRRTDSDLSDRSMASKGNDYKLQGNTGSRDFGHGKHEVTPRTTNTTNVVGTPGNENTIHTRTDAAHDAHTKKPSLVNKLNPFTDADGDGKKGVMH